MLTAQQTLKSELNLPRIEDEIIKQQVEYKDPGRSGDKVIWDFSKLQSINDEYSLVYSAPGLIGDSIYIMGMDTIQAEDVENGELIIGTEHYTMYYYRLSGNQLWTLGHENPTTLLQYTEPLLSSVFPVNFQDNHKEKYSTRGIYSSSQTFSSSGEVEIKADAQGMMILPSGDTLKQVMRVHSVQTIVQTGISGDSLQSRSILENYKWYSKGYRYPIFETVRSYRTNEGAESDLFGTAFFYPPQDHYYLDDDLENLSLLDENETTNPDPWEGLNYNFYPNPIKNTPLNIELYLPKKAQIKLELRNQTGLLLLNENKGSFSEGVHHLTVDLPILSAGNYIMVIFLDDYRISEILMKR
jgi:hypothetical protein